MECVVFVVELMQNCDPFLVFDFLCVFDENLSFILFLKYMHGMMRNDQIYVLILVCKLLIFESVCHIS